MRPSRAFTYEIDRLPDVPEVLDCIVERTGMTNFGAYSTFNMGCGFAIYCESGWGAKIVDRASELGFDAHVAGRVVAGARRVVLKQLGITYEGSQMDLSPRRTG
jgi:phosphoribosylformylglycinamidine cyclo-ligase